MGAAFAVQVMTGKENNVQKLMEWAFSKSETAQKWIKAIHNFTESTVRILSDGSFGKEIQRAVMPGYIFLEMNYSVDENNQSAYIPADVWHLIKSIPGVLKQFTNSGQIIGAEEFRNMLGMDTEEKIEVAVPVQDAVTASEVSKVSETERDIKKALHQVNMASSEEERAVAGQALEAAEQQMSQMTGNTYEESEGLVATALKKLANSGLISRIKTLVRGGKECVRVPKSMMNTIILQTDESDKLSPTVIITRLLNYIRNVGKG
ncbi:transcription termination/antitermination NusG family protein [Paenibacillus sonchi]|uniref:transcription termination/antitermination NusG family protein n=1 Tax=Paenibacillus sonchi TaxID=373687 RepID=UPI001E53C8A1|nr:transcription termination/antitermination NusG family protein [Paenibacillus sonchi]MCE3203501.1 hypothetical protein [Paenibacillus sonchi]